MNQLKGAMTDPTLDDNMVNVICNAHKSPSTKISISSRETLEIMVTKSFISVLKMLPEQFSVESLKRLDSKEVTIEPVIIQNRTAQIIKLPIKENTNQGIHGESRKINPNEDVPLILRPKARDYISPLRDQSDQSEMSTVT